MSLEWFRRHQKHFLAGLAVFLMVAWGLGGALNNLFGKRYAGRVFGKKVPLGEFQDFGYRWQKSLVGSRYQRGISKAELWDNYMLLVEAERLGLMVSPDEVRFRILADPRFYDKTGFNGAAYQNFLRQTGLDVAMHEETVKEQLLASKLLSLLQNSAKVPTGEAWDEYAEENEKVKVRYVVFEADVLASDVEMTEEELKTFYETHKGNFPDAGEGKPGYKRDEAAKLEYVIVRKDSLNKPDEVTDKEIQVYYDEHKESYKIEEEDKPDEKKEGKTKEDAKKESKEEKKEEKPKYRPLKDVNDEIRKKLAEEKAGNRLTTIVDKIDRKVVSKMDKEEECSLAEVAVELKEDAVGYVRTAFIAQSNAKILPGRLDFQKDVVDFEEMTPSAVTDCAGGKFIYQLLAIDPAKVLPFEEVKKRVEADLRSDKALKKAMEIAEECRSKAKTLEDSLKMLKEKLGAKGKGLAIKESQFFTRPTAFRMRGGGRHQFNTGIPGDHPLFADEAFRLREDAVGLVVEEGAETTCYLMALSGREAADRDEFEKEKSRLIQRYTFTKMSALQDAWMADLRKRANLERFKN